MKMLRVSLLVLGAVASMVQSAPVAKNPVVPVPAAKKPAAKPAEPARQFAVVENALVVYRKVAALAVVDPKDVVRFFTQETTDNLKNAFASAQSHSAVSQSIIPAIKNLREFVDVAVTELKKSDAKELKKTLKIELKDDRESVVVDFVFKKEIAAGAAKGSKPVVTASVTVNGLASVEPVHFRHLLTAVLLDDSFMQKHGLLVGAGVGALGVAGLVTAVIVNSNNKKAAAAKEAEEKKKAFDEEEARLARAKEEGKQKKLEAGRKKADELFKKHNREFMEPVFAGFASYVSGKQAKRDTRRTNLFTSFIDGKSFAECLAEKLFQPPVDLSGLATSAWGQGSRGYGQYEQAPFSKAAALSAPSESGDGERKAPEPVKNYVVKVDEVVTADDQEAQNLVVMVTKAKTVKAIVKSLAFEPVIKPVDAYAVPGYQPRKSKIFVLPKSLFDWVDEDEEDILNQCGWTVVVVSDSKDDAIVFEGEPVGGREPKAFTDFKAQFASINSCVVLGFLSPRDKKLAIALSSRVFDYKQVEFVQSTCLHELSADAPQPLASDAQEVSPTPGLVSSAGASRRVEAPRLGLDFAFQPVSDRQKVINQLAGVVRVELDVPQVLSKDSVRGQLNAFVVEHQEALQVLLSEASKSQSGNDIGDRVVVVLNANFLSTQDRVAILRLNLPKVLFVDSINHFSTSVSVSVWDCKSQSSDWIELSLSDEPFFGRVEDADQLSGAAEVDVEDCPRMVCAPPAMKASGDDLDSRQYSQSEAYVYIPAPQRELTVVDRACHALNEFIQKTYFGAPGPRDDDFRRLPELFKGPLPLTYVGMGADQGPMLVDASKQLSDKALSQTFEALFLKDSEDLIGHYHSENSARVYAFSLDEKIGDILGHLDQIKVSGAVPIFVYDYYTYDAEFRSTNFDPIQRSVSEFKNRIIVDYLKSTSAPVGSSYQYRVSCVTSEEAEGQWFDTLEEARVHIVSLLKTKFHLAPATPSRVYPSQAPMLPYVPYVPGDYPSVTVSGMTPSSVGLSASLWTPGVPSSVTFPTPVSLRALPAPMTTVRRSPPAVPSAPSGGVVQRVNLAEDRWFADEHVRLANEANKTVIFENYDDRHPLNIPALLPSLNKYIVVTPSAYGKSGSVKYRNGKNQGFVPLNEGDVVAEVVKQVLDQFFSS